MKVIATTRTRNEEANIERFCTAYGTFCDEIIIADGGSEDRTVEIAESMPKTFVYPFHKRVWNAKRSHWRNPHGEHINFCIQTALDHEADWIIFDDCDDVPSLALQQMARRVMELNLPTIHAYRLYVYKEDRYFPELNAPGHSLWAWQPSKILIWADESNPWKHAWKPDRKHVLAKDEETGVKVFEPLVLLHYFAPDNHTINKKLQFYRDSGQHPDMLHPVEFGGELKKLPEWAVWK